jgi:glycosyltransferase involved in cell wall biosynthesis
MDVAAIVTTTGNRPGLLPLAIRSVVAQTRRPDEILVVLDGPPPTTPLLPDDLAYHVEVVATGVRAGVSRSRNLGAELARSEYVAFLDDDDKWKPDHLAACLARGVDLCLASFEKHRSGEAWPEKTPPAVLHPRAFLVSNPGLRGSNIVIRRDAYGRIGGFDEGLPALNDLDFGVRASLTDGLEYRRVRARTVEFHSHADPRLTSRSSTAINEGVGGFWRRWRHLMNDTEADRFGDRARLLFGVDLGAEHGAG